MNARKTIITTVHHDDVTGGKTTIYRRAFQPIKKDGTDAKRAPRLTSKQLVVYADGSKRFYSYNGVLAFEKVSADRWAKETSLFNMTDIDDHI